MAVAATIDATGISAPGYDEILSYLKTQYRAIYGSDVYLEADSQDGQLLAILSSAINDCNQVAISVWNAFSPATAQGVGLSSVVKVNGIARLVSSKSSVDVLIVGQAGTIITNGIVADALENQWTLPATVVIPLSGEITATATAVEAGAIGAAVGTVSRIVTPTRGWQSVTNAFPATLGAPVEDDATLRARQSASTALSSVTPGDAIYAAIANLSGVQRLEIYENDSGATDANGIPSHSICAVVSGGDSFEIAQAIALKKAPGAGTYGDVSEIVVDARGVPATIRYQNLVDVPIGVGITLRALSGYVSTTGDKIRSAVADFVSSLAIGEDVYRDWIAGEARTATDPALDRTYVITQVLLGRDGATPSATDISIGFDEGAILDTSNITITVIT